MNKKTKTILLVLASAAIVGLVAAPAILFISGAWLSSSVDPVVDLTEEHKRQRKLLELKMKMLKEQEKELEALEKLIQKRIQIKPAPAPAGKKSKPVYCVANGKVTSIVHENQLYNVKIDHGSYITEYRDLHQVAVKVNQAIKKGVMIGKAQLAAGSPWRVNVITKQP